MQPDPYGPVTEPPSVTVLEGEIVVLGDYVAVTYTPEAALEAGRRLMAAAESATTGARRS